VPRDTPKKDKVAELIAQFRLSGNQDNAFDALAAKRLGVSTTDLHCLNIIESNGGVTAGDLARLSGLTTGAVTGVIDRLEDTGYARRVADPADRRKVNVEVTDEFYARADEIWGPLAADWESTLTRRFTVAELTLLIEFLSTTNEIARRHLDGLATGSEG
jgi:DNA-binding MarR family transcriptional regulator